MRELTSIVLEMERQSKRLGELLRVGRLNTMTRAEFRDLVATADRLRVNLADFNALHFGPSSLRRLQSARKYAGRKRRRQSASAPESAVALHFGWYNFASYLSTLTIQWLPLRPPQAQPRQLLSAAHQPANIP
jgi:hypothetical protein